MCVCSVAVAVVVAFVACWAPFHAQRLLTIYTQDDQWTDALLETQSLLFYISGMLAACYISITNISNVLYSLSVSINDATSYERVSFSSSVNSGNAVLLSPV